MAPKNTFLPRVAAVHVWWMAREQRNPGPQTVFTISYDYDGMEN